jgi:predicted metal-dependent HD superfamily phosphohydrolase
MHRPPGPCANAGRATPEVELALWFHDAVHDTRRADNEALSAAWARQVAHEANAPTDVAERLHDLVMATRHVGLPSSPDQQLLVDIDLAILGAPPVRFDQYETPGARGVRVGARKPTSGHDDGPSSPGFLARPAIYRTGHFHALLEGRARANLARSIAGPES